MPSVLEDGKWKQKLRERENNKLHVFISFSINGFMEAQQNSFCPIVEPFSEAGLVNLIKQNLINVTTYKGEIGHVVWSLIALVQR